MPQIFLDRPFRMQQTANDIAYSNFLRTQFAQPRGAFLWPASGRQPRSLSGLGFSCAPGWVQCKNANGDDICLMPGLSCDGPGDFSANASGPAGPQCQDFYTWTAQAGMEDCSQYCNTASCDQALATACNSRNNARSIAIQDIQIAYGDCFPPGASFSVNPSTGAWTVTNPGGNSASGFAAGANPTYNVATSPTQTYPTNPPPSYTPTPAPVSNPTPAQPVSVPASGAPPSTSGSIQLPAPSGYANQMNPPAPLIPSGGTQTGSTPAASAPSGDLFGLSQNTLLLIGAGVAALLLFKR